MRNTLSLIVSCLVFMLALCVMFSAISFIASPCRELLAVEGSRDGFGAYFKCKPGQGCDSFNGEYEFTRLDITQDSYVRAVIGLHYKTAAAIDLINLTPGYELVPCTPPEPWVDPRTGETKP